MPNLAPPNDNDIWGPYVSSDSHDPEWSDNVQHPSPREWALQQDSVPSELPPQPTSFSELSRNLRRIPSSVPRRPRLPAPDLDPIYIDPIHTENETDALPGYSEQDPSRPPSRWDVGNPNTIVKTIDSFHKGKRVLSEVHYRNHSSRTTHYPYHQSDKPNNVEYTSLTPHGDKHTDYIGDHPLSLDFPVPDTIVTHIGNVRTEHHIESSTQPEWKKETHLARTENEDAPGHNVKNYEKITRYGKTKKVPLEVLKSAPNRHWVKHESWPLENRKSVIMSNGQGWVIKPSGTRITTYPNGIKKQIQLDGTSAYFYPNGITDINWYDGSKQRDDNRTGRKIIYTSPDDPKYPNSILHVEPDNSTTLYTQSGVYKGRINDDKDFEPNDNIPENVPHDSNAASALVTAPDNEFINMPEKFKFSDYQDFHTAES